MDDGSGPDSDRGSQPDPDERGYSDGGWSAKSSSASPDLRQVAQDWISLWQSELSALALDREAQENWQTLLTMWAGIATAMINAVPRGRPPQSAGPPPSENDDATRRTRPEPAQGTQAAPAAPDPRDAEIERLARHVAELEARLASIERGNQGGAENGPRRRKRR